MEEFISTYGIEILGTVSSLIYLYYSIKEKVWCWPWGIVASVLSIYVFFIAGLYADMALQFYYLFISVYGWYFWLHGTKNNKDDGAVIVRTSAKQWIALVAIGIVIYFILLGGLLYLPPYLQIAGSSMPFLDAFTTAASIVATWMLARKMIEHWLIWIVVDAVSAAMYIYKGIYFYSFLFVVYTVGAIMGYISWRKTLENNLKK
ncbi:MAG: nicotinamide mononucleotide transporter [Chlorobi bacterium]|nr:nicotinamide mononucleotide transporter [Chlorobiota bacterium]